MSAAATNIEHGHARFDAELVEAHRIHVRSRDVEAHRCNAKRVILIGFVL